MSRHLHARLLLAAALAGTACRAESRPPDAYPDAYPHASEPIGTVREIYDGTLTPEMAVNTFRNIDRLFPTRAVAPSATPRVLDVAPRPLRDVRFVSGDSTVDLERYLDLNRVAAILVLK